MPNRGNASSPSRPAPTAISAAQRVATGGSAGRRPIRRGIPGSIQPVSLVSSWSDESATTPISPRVGAKIHARQSGDGMGKLVVSEFISLDGVIEDPGGAEGYAYGGWSF